MVKFSSVGYKGQKDVGSRAGKKHLFRLGTEAFHCYMTVSPPPPSTLVKAGGGVGGVGWGGSLVLSARIPGRLGARQGPRKSCVFAKRSASSLNRKKTVGKI